MTISFCCVHDSELIVMTIETYFLSLNEQRKILDCKQIVITISIIKRCNENVSFKL